MEEEGNLVLLCSYVFFTRLKLYFLGLDLKYNSALKNDCKIVIAGFHVCYLSDFLIKFAQFTSKKMAFLFPNCGYHTLLLESENQAVSFLACVLVLQKESTFES